MSLIDTVKGMDQKFSWSFLGFLMAIIFGLITIYLGFIREDKPDVKYVVTSNFGVLDVKERLGSLDILYEGRSLSKEGKDLKVITLVVINQGNAPVLPIYYDSKDPLGFWVEHGELVGEPKVVQASSKYLKEGLTLSVHANSGVTFSSVIIEPGDSFSIKILVLHDEGVEPRVVSKGQIAGDKEVEVLSDYTAGETSLINSVFGGGYLAVLFRFLAYGIVAIALVIGVLVLVLATDTWKDKRKRKKIVKTFVDYEEGRLSMQDDFYIQRYVNDGWIGISRMESILTRVRHNSEVAEKYPGSVDYDLDIPDDDKRLDDLILAGVIQKIGDRYSIDEDRHLAFVDFCQYLLKKDTQYRKITSVTDAHRDTLTQGVAGASAGVSETVE